jgi:hypothetical protein
VRILPEITPRLVKMLDIIHHRTGDSSESLHSRQD